MSERTGGCACGAVRFKVSAPFVGIGVCHCTDCQKASGGGPNYTALAPSVAFEVTKGEARSYATQAASGETVQRAFCGDCGSPLWSAPPNTPLTAVKLGALDDNADLTPMLHLYTESAPSWHPMNDDLPRFGKMPPFPPPGA